MTYGSRDGVRWSPSGKLSARNTKMVRRTFAKFSGGWSDKSSSEDADKTASLSAPSSYSLTQALGMDFRMRS
eukprot:CAMPEP_0115546162 /NCGR_PEP_ID=MMETSP0271-20121206/92984_1 /TAXON_ID=71861 /ORGANISM="Scrippsiella trochoidea, Strain CCMP3099" /LENGTH=71 /DNA_ID=CAMNT_0002979545 /DNA_START=337 /DNA_END=549 /DNA_ORIENTATION=+